MRHGWQRYGWRLGLGLTLALAAGCGQPRRLGPAEGSGPWPPLAPAAQRLVAARLGSAGTPVQEPRELWGLWEVALAPGREPQPGARGALCELQASGRFEERSLGSEGKLRPSRGSWQLNPDGTLSLTRWLEPDPDKSGLEHGAWAEERYHLFRLNADRLATCKPPGQPLWLWRRSTVGHPVGEPQPR